MIETNYDMDLNHISIGTPIDNLEFDMWCPCVGDTNRTVNNWSTEQCRLRIEIGNPCAGHCTYKTKLEQESSK